MKERFFDVIKWGLILVIAGVVLYCIVAKTYGNLYPKFEFYKGNKELHWFRCNKITGEIERWQSPEIKMEYGKWESLGPLAEEERSKRLMAERERKALDLMETFFGRGRPVSELEKNYRDDLLKKEYNRVRMEETLLMMDRVDAELADRRKAGMKSGPTQKEDQ